MLNDPEWARVLPALLLLKTHQYGIADLEERMEQHQDEILGGVVRAASTKGVLRPDVDVEQAAATAIGPMLFAHLTGKLPVDVALGEHVVETVLRAYVRPDPTLSAGRRRRLALGVRRGRRPTLVQ